MFHQNSMSNDLTKTEPRLFCKLSKNIWLSPQKLKSNSVESTCSRPAMCLSWMAIWRRTWTSERATLGQTEGSASISSRRFHKSWAALAAQLHTDGPRYSTQLGLSQPNERQSTLCIVSISIAELRSCLAKTSRFYVVFKLRSQFICQKTDCWVFSWLKVKCYWDVMDCAPNVNIFRELQVVHDTGYFSSHVSPEEDWQQVQNNFAVQISHGSILVRWFDIGLCW